jgi:LacI family transcriptional regulator
MAVKITDVAKYAKVSTSVVHRVLNNSGYVSQEKRIIVEKAIKELNYIPNQVAKGLKNRKTKMIGHILPATYPNPFFAGVSYGVDSEADICGYHVLTLFSYYNAKRENELINSLASRMVDGIIFTGAISADNVRRVQELQLPIVMVERTMGITGVDSVLVDNYQGAFSAVNTLIEKYHRNIAFIGTLPEEEVEIHRYEGYRNALKAANLPVQEKYIRFAEEYEPKLGYELAREVMEQEDRPTAIFTSSDLLAIGILQYLYCRKLRVPEDISIISYDNSYSSLLSPKLTTVENPMQELGKTAVRLMVDRLENKSQAVKTITLSTKLIQGDSVRTLK